MFILKRSFRCKLPTLHGELAYTLVVSEFTGCRFGWFSGGNGTAHQGFHLFYFRIELWCWLPTRSCPGSVLCKALVLLF